MVGPCMKGSSRPRTRHVLPLRFAQQSVTLILSYCDSQRSVRLGVFPIDVDHGSIPASPARRRRGDVTVATAVAYTGVPLSEGDLEYPDRERLGNRHPVLRDLRYRRALPFFTRLANPS